MTRMKKYLISSSIAAFGFILFLTLSSPVRAQVPGSIVSAGALGGAQSSSINGIGSGDYYSVRGSFTNLFGELRHADWGNSSASIHENGILAGADVSLFHIMVAGAVGVGHTDYQAPSPISGTTVPTVGLTSLLYEAQAMYQFEIVAGVITAGIGADYIGESNSAENITGWGGVASISVGL
jgi:hypothetical protein